MRYRGCRCAVLERRPRSSVVIAGLVGQIEITYPYQLCDEVINFRKLVAQA